jgi:GNAT superfamily N-acetyltransferase
MTNTPEFDGPRPVLPAELHDSHRLFQVCFNGLDPAEYLAELEQPEGDPPRPMKHGELYGTASGGRLVSQIALFPEQVRVYDGLLRLGSIGGVCTHPHFRGYGVASRLLDLCTARLEALGARLLFISGGRGLYLRAGAVPVGRYARFNLKPGQLNLPPRTDAAHPLTLRDANAGDAPLCSRLYAAEPVHLVRKVSLFEERFGHGNGYIYKEKWLAEVEGQPRAYLLLGEPWEHMGQTETRIRYLSEYAGSRATLAAAVGELLEQPGMTELTLYLPWQEVDFIQRLVDLGATPEWEPLDGHTMRIINFPGLQQDLRPYIQSRLATKLQIGLRFEQSGPLLGTDGGDRLSISRGSDRLELNGAEMTRLVMGAPGYTPPDALGALSEIITALFPLPSILPGLNYH